MHACVFVSLLAPDFNSASSEGTGVRQPYMNWTKTSSSQLNDATVPGDMALDLSDRGNRKKTLHHRTIRETVKLTAVQQTQPREESATTPSSDEDGVYIPPSEIASVPVPMPRKSLHSKKAATLPKDNGLYLQM